MHIPQGTVQNFGNAKNINGGTNHGGMGNENNQGSIPPSSHTTNHGSYNQSNRTYHNTDNDYSRNDLSTDPTKNVDRGAVQNFGNAKNINGGTNYGGMGNEDNRGSIPTRVHDGYAQRDYGYEQGGYRPAMTHPYSNPAPGSYSGPYEGAGYTPHGPVPLAAEGWTPASHPQAGSDITASAPPSMASSSNGGAEGATPPMKSDKELASPKN